MSVPKYRLDAIETIGRKILQEYDPVLLDGPPQAVPIETIIETKFDLTLEYHCLRKNGSILGETIFDEGAAILYDQDEKRYRLIAVKAGTILVEERLCVDRLLGRLRFTCAHELGHWVLHQKLYSGTGDVAAYASVECIERGLNPLDTNLVVADLSRTEKTICLAVTPSLKSYGISGRARLFEVIQRVKEVNAQRQRNTPGRQFTGASSHDPEVRRNPSLALDYIVAPPRMAHYIDWSTRVYSVYLKHVAPEDIYPYSIDEVFIDATSYLQTYHLSAREFARKIILDILQTTGITAAAGIGTNLYLAKVAMDIGAKHVPADEYGVRIAELDEMGYRRSFWTHRPLTDFWRVGKGYAAKLEANGLYTMGDIARCSIGQPTDYHNEELLYKLFGVNAELLIDHAWGWEPCTIADIKAYKPENKSIVSGQILQYPYPFEKARLVIQEMADALALELVDKRLATNQLVLTVGYDIENLKGTAYTGEVTTDRYGRKIPKHAHGTVNLDGYTSSGEELLKAATSLYDRIVDKTLLARRLTLCANHLLDESSVPEDLPEQIDLFTDYSAKEKQKKEADTAHARERKLQETMLDIKKRFGKNAILKGLNLEDGATARERNNQIGGHKA